MKRILMNKNKEVLVAEYDSGVGVFTEVYDIYNIDYAPYILKSFYNDDNFNDTSFRTILVSGFKEEEYHHGVIS